MAEAVAVADVPQPEKMTATSTPSMDNNPINEDSKDINDHKIAESLGFKEESTLRTHHLLHSEKIALQELRTIVQKALQNHDFSNAKRPPSTETEENKNLKEAEERKSSEETILAPEETKAITEEKAAVDDDGAKTLEAIEETIVAVSAKKVEEVETAEEQVSIWGIPLLADERSDTILLKFLRARDFKVKEAFTMLKKTIEWRKEFRIDGLLEEDLEIDLAKAVFMHGYDKQGHPVCYNVYGDFQDKKVYNDCFSDDEKRNRFLRWRIQMLEITVRKLDFTQGGMSTIVHVNDLKNSPGPTKTELRQTTNQALQLFQDNYPEFVAKQVLINVPWWYIAVNRMISPFLTQRTRSKFVFAAPSKSPETLLRYIGGEQIPVKYGGLSKDGGEFETTDAVTQITVKPAANHTVEFPVSEKCEVKWEVRVIGWEVRYGAEFVPNAQGSYTIIIQKARKIDCNGDEQVQNQSFKIGEPGKLVLTIHNPTSNNKKLLYRFKTNNISSF
ncbi:Patellin-5 [Euphorbia peplus]|nr:Patellin-5 [Euphorbia peplus]